MLSGTHHATIHPFGQQWFRTGRRRLAVIQKKQIDLNISPEYNENINGVNWSATVRDDDLDVQSTMGGTGEGATQTVTAQQVVSCSFAANSTTTVDKLGRKNYSRLHRKGDGDGEH